MSLSYNSSPKFKEILKENMEFNDLSAVKPISFFNCVKNKELTII
jgi:hypothetical protein